MKAMPTAMMLPLARLLSRLSPLRRRALRLRRSPSRCRCLLQQSHSPRVTRLSRSAMSRRTAMPRLLRRLRLLPPLMLRLLSRMPLPLPLPLPLLLKRRRVRAQPSPRALPAPHACTCQSPGAWPGRAPCRLSVWRLSCAYAACLSLCRPSPGRHQPRPLVPPRLQLRRQRHSFLPQPHPVQPPLLSRQLRHPQPVLARSVAATPCPLLRLLQRRQAAAPPPQLWRWCRCRRARRCVRLCLVPLLCGQATAARSLASSPSPSRAALQRRHSPPLRCAA